MDASTTPGNAPSGPISPVPGAAAAPSSIEMLGEEFEAAAKRWWKSKTLIVNASVAGLLAAESQVHLLQPMLPVNVYAFAAFALPVVNSVLRFATSTRLC